MAMTVGAWAQQFQRGPGLFSLPQDAASLTQRYSHIPETFSQLAIMNGWNQGSAPAPGPSAGPVTPAPGPSAGPVTPGGSPAVSPTGGGGGSLADLRAQILGYDPTGGINEAFRLTKEQALQSLGMDVEDTLAARGVTTGSATGQDLKSRLTAQLLGPLQAQHAQALANAQAERLSRLTGLVGMELDQARAQQEADYRRQRDAVEDAYRQGQISLQQRQFEQSQQASANQLDWQKQLQAWQREDRTQQQRGGGMDPAERARAIIMGGSRSGGGGGGGGSDLPITPTGHTMGGGVGLAGLSNTNFGEPTPNWNSGAGRSGAPRPPRAFEGPGTSTVHSASGGGQTTAGTGTWASSPTWTPQTSGPSQNMSPTSQRFQAAQGPGPAPTTLSSLYQPKPRQWGNA